jgi:putative holliday junction resolvase
MPVVIGLDIGKKRTGIAKSDTMGILIKPLKTVLSENLIKELKKLEQELGIEQFVIGEPINIETGNKDAHNFVMKMKNEISRNFPSLKINLIDERFTSKEAQTALKNQGKKITKDNKELIDMYAAGIILEQYFNFNDSLEE